MGPFQLYFDFLQLCARYVVSVMRENNVSRKWSKYFYFIIDPFLKENRKSNKPFPCVEMVENMELYPYISKFSAYLPIFINIHVC